MVLLCAACTCCPPEASLATLPLAPSRQVGMGRHVVRSRHPYQTLPPFLALSLTAVPAPAQFLNQYDTDPFSRWDAGQVTLPKPSPDSGCKASGRGASF